jgi:polyhydroxyalkanoate synthase
LYQENQLIRGEYEVNGQRVDLNRITIPVLNVMASDDEIVPVTASKVLKQYVPAENYAEKIFPSGHIGIYVSEKVAKAMPHEIAEWLSL